MRTGAALGHRGFFHETAFYQSDDEFLAVIVPFLREGLTAGEPTVAAFGEANERLVRAALGPGNGVSFLAAEQQYARPALAIKRYQEMFADLVASGATQIRVVGDVPHPGVGVPWEWWARYEAAVNHAYDDFPVWGVCPYDTRTAPPEVLDQVRLTHPRIVTAAGHLANDAFEDPHGFVTGRVAPWRDPLEGSPPVVELVDPGPALARDVVAAWQARAALREEDLNGLLLATSEAVTNAMTHGRPPVRLRVWAVPGRMVVTITDGGTGPVEPYAGLVPGGGPGGFGLWLAHQLCAYVSMQRDHEGFTLRLVAGSLV